MVFVWASFIFCGIFMGGYFKKELSSIYFFFVLLIVLFGFSEGTADYYGTYLDTYNSSIEGDFSNLFSVLNYVIGNFFGFRGVVFFIASLGMFLIYLTAMKFSNNSLLVVSLYALFPFVIDVTQMRNFLAMAIFVFSFRYLIEENKCGSCKYIICILIASFVHTSFLVCLVFLLARFFSVKKVCIFSLMVSSFCVFFACYFELMDVLSYFPSESIFVEKYIAYQVSQTVKEYEPINRIFLQIMGFSIFIFFLKLCVYSKANFVSNRETHIVTMVLKINILQLIMIPLVYYSMEFYRTQQNILILNYIAFSIGIFRTSKNKLVILLKLMLCASYAGVFLYLIVLRHVSESVFWPLFNNNVFVKCLMGLGGIT